MLLPKLSSRTDLDPAARSSPPTSIHAVGFSPPSSSSFLQLVCQLWRQDSSSWSCKQWMPVLVNKDVYVMMNKSMFEQRHSICRLGCLVASEDRADRETSRI